MIFTWERESPTGTCVLKAAAEDYDGYPTQSVLVTDMVPRTVSADRLAVAFVLAFRPYLSGGIKFPYEVHPETASAICEFLAPASVFISGIDFKPDRIPHGPGIFALNPDGRYSVDRTWRGFDSSRVIELQLSSVSESFSHNFSDDLLVVPTNAATFVADTPDTQPAIFPYMASAVLLSEDFDIGTIRVPSEMPNTQLLLKAATLLRSAGLVLQVAS